jgi:hypothetical protein
MGHLPRQLIALNHEADTGAKHDEPPVYITSRELFRCLRILAFL